MRAVSTLVLGGWLLGCGAAAQDGAQLDELAREAEPVAQTIHSPAETIHSPASSARPTPAPVSEPAPAPALTRAPKAPPSPPAPPPAPTPEPVEPPAPEPTPADPLILDCVDGGCASCSIELQQQHPDWIDSGAAACSMRECETDDDCSDLGASLVCLPYLTLGGRPVCRAERLPERASCSVDEEAHSQNVPLCELGLVCKRTNLSLHCRPL